jgi:hypothetical protein
VLVRRLEPLFEPPSKAEADSPVGPLQRHVAEPYFEEWKHVDWPSFTLGVDANGLFEQGGGGSTGVVGEEWTIDNGDVSLGGGEHLYDFGRGYYPVFHYAPNKPDDDFNIS